MQADGYDAVRVFLDVTCYRVPDRSGLRPTTSRAPYLGNLVDFLGRAKAHGIYVLIAAEALPYGSLYETNANAGHGPNFGAENIQYLTANGAEWNGRFWIALIQAMNSLGAPLDTVWGYELVGRAVLPRHVASAQPRHRRCLDRQRADLDMAVAGQKRLMMDENLVWWADQVRSAILSVDSTALVGMGFLGRRGRTRPASATRASCGRGR